MCITSASVMGVYITSVKYSDCLKEEAVVEYFGSSTDAPVPSTRQQRGEKPIRGVGGVVHNAAGPVDAVLVEGGIRVW